MQYVRTARDIFSTANQVVSDISGGKIKLDKIGAKLGQQALNKIGGVAKNKFGQIVKQRQDRFGVAKRTLKKGQQLWDKIPEFLQTGQNTLTTVQNALQQSPFGESQAVRNLSNLAAQGSNVLDSVMTRHNQLKDNLNPNTIQTQTNDLLNKLLPQDDDMLGGLNRNIRMKLNNLHYSF